MVVRFAGWLAPDGALFEDAGASDRSRAHASRSTGERSRRTRTRALANAGLARRSSVDHRIAAHCPCHLHARPARYHPAVQSISLLSQPASLRCALASRVASQLADPAWRTAQRMWARH